MTYHLFLVEHGALTKEWEFPSLSTRSAGLHKLPDGVLFLISLVNFMDLALSLTSLLHFLWGSLMPPRFR